MKTYVLEIHNKNKCYILNVQLCDSFIDSYSHQFRYMEKTDMANEIVTNSNISISKASIRSYYKSRIIDFTKLSETNKEIALDQVYYNFLEN